jgi:hypothetical protein
MYLFSDFSNTRELEKTRLIEITIESRVIKKIGDRGGPTVIFLLRPNYFWGR